MLLNRYVRCIILSIAGICVLVPFLIMVLRAFSGSWFYPDIFPRISFENIDRYFHIDNMRKALTDSIVLSLLVTFISAILGFLPAKYLGTKKFKGKMALYLFLLIPAVTPGICVVFGIVEVLVKLGIYRTYAALLFSQVVFTAPYFIFVMMPVFKRYDTDMDDQSAILGVSRSSTLFNVTIPAVKSGLASAMMLTFVISWSMYLVTAATAPIGFQTMATMLLTQLGAGYAFDPYVSVMALLFVIPAMISVLISTGVVARDRANSRRGER